MTNGKPRNPRQRRGRRREVPLRDVYGRLHEPGEPIADEAWEAIFAYGHCPYDPSCAALLNEPLAVFADASRWPTHLCFNTMELSVEQWKAAAILQTAWGCSLAGSIPTPVGRRAVLTDAHSLGWHDETLSAALQGAPFAGDECALLVVRCEIAGTTVAFFGLSRPGIAHGTEEVGAVVCGPCRFTAVGDNPTCEAVRAFIGRARRWWAQFEGRPVTGRPSGSTVSAEDLHRAVAAIRDAGWRPTQESVAEYLDRSVSTISRSAKGHFGSWQTLVNFPSRG